MYTIRIRDYTGSMNIRIRDYAVNILFTIRIRDYAVNMLVYQYALEAITQWTCIYTIRIRDYARAHACIRYALITHERACVQYALEITQWTCMYTIRIRDYTVNSFDTIRIRDCSEQMHVYNTH